MTSLERESELAAEDARLKCQLAERAALPNTSQSRLMQLTANEKKLSGSNIPFSLFAHFICVGIWLKCSRCGKIRSRV